MRGGWGQSRAGKAQSSARFRDAAAQARGRAHAD